MLTGESRNRTYLLQTQVPSVFGLLKSSGLKFIYKKDHDDGTTLYMFDAESDDPMLKELRQIKDYEDISIEETNRVPVALKT